MRLVGSVLLMNMMMLCGAVIDSKGETAPLIRMDGSQEMARLNLNGALTPEAFAERVVKAGGRIDFIVGDERPFQQCHASTLVETATGDLLAAWFGGTREKAPDVGIWVSRFANGTWTASFRIAKVTETAHWNPVLFRDPKRGVFLFVKVGVDVPHWATYWMHSQDDGVSWSEPEELVPGDVGGRGPVKNPPIILSDGAWLAPASTELGQWNTFADRSEDGGLTWERTADFELDRNDIRGKGIIQPTFWESSPGRIHALMRTSGQGLARCNSEDNGRTWSKVYRSGLPNNNSGVCAVRLEDGRLLLVLNPVEDDWGKRTPLSLIVSMDNGMTWKALAHLETTEGEFSYPTIVQTREGVALTYTWKRERVRCWQIPLAALEE